VLEKCIIYASKCDRYATPEETPNFPEIPNLTKLSFNEVQKWFNEIFSGIIFIHTINGNSLNGSGGYTCDYCRENINDENIYYYCSECFQDMCYKCYEKKTKDEYVNLNSLSSCECVKLHELYERYYVNRVYCSLCKKAINDDFKFTNKPYIGHNYDTMDICVRCSENGEGERFISDNDLIKTSNCLPYHGSGYGNFMEWIPIYKDVSKSMIFINLNPDSPKFKQVSMSKYLRWYQKGISIVSINKTFDKFINEINTSNKYDFEEFLPDPEENDDDRSGRHQQELSIINKFFKAHYVNDDAGW
jgi:hypothetical protein